MRNAFLHPTGFKRYLSLASSYCKCSQIPLLNPWLGFKPHEWELRRIFCTQLRLSIEFIRGFWFTWYNWPFTRCHICQATMKSTQVFVYMREVTWTKVTSSCTRKLWCHVPTYGPHICIPFPPSSGLIMRGEPWPQLTSIYLFFRQTSTTDKHLRDGPLSVRQQTLALMDWPSCFIWDISVTAGSVWQP